MYTTSEPHNQVYVGRRNITAEAGVNGVGYGLNSKGRVTWAGGGHVWVDTEKITDGILPGQGYYYQPVGLSEDGRPLWFVDYRPSTGKEDEIYVGRESLNAGSLLGANREVSGVDINASGVPAWYGKGDLTGGRNHAFRGTEDISSPVVGAQGWGEATDINDSGQLLWHGVLTVGGPGHVYVDATDISGPVLGPEGGGIGRAINNAGQVMWDGSGPVTNRWIDVFLDEVNLSRSVYGDTSYRQATGFYLSETGHVMWEGYGNLGDGEYFGIFVDDRNLSRDVLGEGRHGMLPMGVDDFGRGLWEGTGTGNGFTYQVYVDGFSLSFDALGSTDKEAFALAMGPNGHALWGARDPQTRLWDVYLSTPVPEPSALLLGLPLLVMLRKRRA